jgi:putative membrane protein
MCLQANRIVRGDDHPAMHDNDDQHNMERDFFRQAASGNTLEIRLAKLAEDRATDPQVKQAAQMMQRDHEDANHLLKQIADQHHIEVNIDELNPVGDAVYKSLEDKQGDQFTHMYVFEQVGDHARDQLILAYHAHNGDSEACRDYSRQVLPKVEMHLHALEQIARPMAGLDASAEPAADRIPSGTK